MAEYSMHFPNHARKYLLYLFEIWHHAARAGNATARAEEFNHWFVNNWLLRKKNLQILHFDFAGILHNLQQF